MSDDHDHDDHARAENTRRVGVLTALLEQRGIVSERELDDMVEAFVARTGPAQGARIVARAWTDTGFRARLLEDANAAVRELGLDMASGTAPHLRLRAVENTPELHNVVVCTLCSCYPVAILGPPPTWYKSESYRSRVVRDPRGVLAELGVELDPDSRIRVWDSSAETRYLVIPRRPEGTEELDEEELAALVSRNALIGTALVEPSAAAR